MFERSVEGQNNRALFYGADYVLYTEGGRDDKEYIESYDALFWKLIIRDLRPEIRLKVIARGSKENLVDFIDGVSSGLLNNVIVARDRDYDDLIGSLVSHPRVLYTFGYSYENDIFRENVVQDLFEILCPVCEVEEDIIDTIAEAYASFSQSVWWVSKADFCGVIVGRAVIDRDHPQRYLENRRYGSKPDINKAELFRAVVRANSGAPRERVVNVALERHMIPRRVVGHLLAAYVFRLLCYIQKCKSDVQNLTHDAVRSTAIQLFSRGLRSEPADEVKNYYRAMIANI